MSDRRKTAMIGMMLPFLMGSPFMGVVNEPDPPKPLTPDQLDRKFRAEQRVIELAEQKRIRKANRSI